MNFLKFPLKFSFKLFSIFLLFFNLPLFNLISIDNDIIGEPDIECLDQEIRVWVKTRKYFQGKN
ncbi:unnamed protein product [Meloidogyne enterolobii]|uniref:Uncharacterized protein n=1 Tax=Meloidogyne enterolobii TaxID=390850 RepID=A0ACB0Y708_MELEN